MGGEMKSYLIKDNVDIAGNKCHAHFEGKDGLGTCNTDCQWWKNVDCLMWVEKKDWNTKRDWVWEVK